MPLRPDITTQQHKKGNTMATEFEAEVLRSLGALSANVEGLRSELVGNGQPGRIQRNEEQIEKLDTKFDGKFNGLATQIDGINKKTWMFTGGLIVASHFLKAALTRVFGGHWN